MAPIRVSGLPAIFQPVITGVESVSDWLDEISTGAEPSAIKTLFSKLPFVII